jgi:hypothetical protein
VECPSKQVEVMERECVKNGSLQGTVLFSVKEIFLLHVLIQVLTTQRCITSSDMVKQHRMCQDKKFTQAMLNITVVHPLVMNSA